MCEIPTIDMIKTGQNIVRLRKAAGLSVKDLQDIFGFTTPQAIYKWQHGTTMPTLDNLVVLASALNVHVDDILVLSDNVPLLQEVDYIKSQML
ncbi:MAG: helix-turn-helix transcriptional regulator [Lachnospiraceae bacterium]|nr:helix-turn-helix transcriptional regulator [Lachnospiraceae bacterium]